VTLAFDNLTADQCDVFGRLVDSPNTSTSHNFCWSHRDQGPRADGVGD